VQGTFVNFLRQAIMFLLLWLVFKGRLTTGEVMTMVFYSFFIFGPLQELGNIILSYREAEASMNNFDTLMKKTPELPPPNRGTWAGYRAWSSGTWCSGTRRRITMRSIISALRSERARHWLLWGHPAAVRRP
jgi:ABC-type multidrug transport system fused ATPase/permease subunit